MIRTTWLSGLAGAGLVLLAPLAHSAVITFDDVVTGATSFAFDGDGDGIDDVVFTTTDPFGFNTAGPGANQQFIDEPGLEGTSELNPDLRVDFLNGAVGPIELGFALNSSREAAEFFASIQVFDANDVLLGSVSLPGVFGGSTFPEGLLSATFDGVASYAIFDFTSEFGRYIIDNVSGTFGSTEIPEPTGLALLGLGLIGLRFMRPRARR
jgi:hypothetical protein